MLLPVLAALPQPLALLEVGASVMRVRPLPQPPDGAAHNVLALDGEPLAWTRSHGQAMTWFGPALSGWDR